MIGYTTVGTNDLEKATSFFDVVLAELGAKRQMETEHMIGWSVAEDQPIVAVTKPHNGEKATVGNGTMMAFAALSTEVVDNVHAKALSLGSVDEGAPGNRGDGFYGAYFRDLDGNKFCVYIYIQMYRWRGISLVGFTVLAMQSPAEPALDPAFKRFTNLITTSKAFRSYVQAFILVACRRQPPVRVLRCCKAIDSV